MAQHTQVIQYITYSLNKQIENPNTKFTYTFRWGADPNAFYARVVSYSVWYVGKGVLHLLSEAPRIVAKMELQPNNGLHEIQYQP